MHSRPTTSALRGANISGISASTTPWPNVTLLLAHRLRCWHNITPTFVSCVCCMSTLWRGRHNIPQPWIMTIMIMTGDLNSHWIHCYSPVYSFDAVDSILCGAVFHVTYIAPEGEKTQDILRLCWPNVGPPSATSDQHRLNILRLPKY